MNEEEGREGEVGEGRTLGGGGAGMKPAAPPGWVNKMDEKEAAKKKKKEAEGVQWHSGILNCCSDPR